MTTLTVALPDDHLAKLNEMAARFGITSEELVRLSIGEWLEHPKKAFRRIEEYVLKKNVELDGRLA